MLSNGKSSLLKKADEVEFFHLKDEPEDDVVFNKWPEDKWQRFGIRLAVITSLHPFEYAKVLIQLGYEPIAAVPGRTLLGKPAFFLPNLFQYTGYIYKVDGIFGCFRGLAPKLIGSITSFVISEQIAERFGLMPNCETEKWQCEEENLRLFKRNLKRDIVLTATGIVISHPFQVISVRMMAQFFGNETIYKNIVDSSLEIFKNEGWHGFFAGLVPRLICDISCCVLTSCAVYMLNKYVLRHEAMRQYNNVVTQCIFSNIFYPLQVVSTCMIVNSSRLAIGSPPQMQKYENWLECCRDLIAKGQAKRGSSLFMRYEVKPTKNFRLTN